MAIFGVICLVLIAGAVIYYFGFYKKGKINDRDGDLIPDEIEDAVEDVKEVAKEVKQRVKNVKKEFQDVKASAKDLVKQSKDVVDAAKGKKRRGRKPKKK